MSLAYFEYEGIFYFVSFLLSLLSLFFIYQLIRRTTEGLKQGYVIIFSSVIAMIIYLSLDVLNAFQIYMIQIIPSVIFLIATGLFLLGINKILGIIKDMADCGQTLLLTTPSNYQKNLVQLLQQTGKTCYVYLSNSTPNPQVVQSLKQRDAVVLTSNESVFDDKNTIHINHEDQKTIKDTLQRILREQRFHTVIFDDITSLNEVKSYELPMVIQDYAETMKQQRVGSYFIADREKIEYSTIEDISMIIDRVKR
jgi:hypothetical protein